MATEYKRLGYVLPATTAKTTLYTVPSGKQAIISSFVANAQFTTGTQTFSIYALTSAGETEADSNTIGKNLTIKGYMDSPGAGTVAFTEGWTLNAGESIAVTSASGSGISFHLFGCEIS